MNLLPLDSFRRIFSFHPFHFWQLADDTIVPVTTDCSTVVYEYAWQGLDSVGREDVAESIAEAEGELRRYLGYRVAPQYTEATVDFPRFYDHRLWNQSFSDANGRWLSVQLPEGQIQAIGIELLTAIGTGNVVASDVDGDGLDDTFTVTIATTETDADKIAVYFAAADRFNGDDASEQWRIRPVKVTISGGNAIIKGAYWLLVKPVLYQGAGKQPLDPTDASNFVTTLEVKIRTTDPDGNTTATSQATLIWETAPYPYWGGCCGGSTDSSRDPAATATAIARVGIRDANNGIVSIGSAQYNSTTGVWATVDWSLCRPPDRVLVRYLAGLPLENQEMQRDWRNVVAKFAAARLNRPVCACQDMNKKIYDEMVDLALSGAEGAQTYNLSAGDLDNPFGTKRGEVHAWRWINRNYITRGFVV